MKTSSALAPSEKTVSPGPHAIQFEVWNHHVEVHDLWSFIFDIDYLWLFMNINEMCWCLSYFQISGILKILLSEWNDYLRPAANSFKICCFDPDQAS